MKNKLLPLIAIVILLAIPKVNFGQINLGTAANFVVYTTGGSVHDNASAHSNLTGDVGYFTSGDFLGFGNIDGVMHPGVDPATTACESDLLSAVAQINTTSNDYFPGLLLGNGVTFTPGVYSIPGSATMTLDLILDAQNIPSSEFIIKIQGTFATGAGAKVKLINGAQACHVYWLVQGQVTMATNTTMKGTVIANNALISMATGDSLEGRLFSTTGAITLDGVTARKPIGCGSTVLTGPVFPNLGSIACYTIFTSIGALDGNLSSTSIGDVGNAGGGSVTGWTAGNVTGTLHPTGDPSTMLAAIDLQKLYDTLNAMIPNIELLYPAEFGFNLVLTPHVYVMNSAVIFTDSVTLDAQGNANAVFVIKILGATSNLSSSVNSKVRLINGAKSQNVFWLINGAVTIGDNSTFRGNIVVPAGAINLWYTGVILDGRALSINGAITTAGLAAAMPPGCGALPCEPTIITEPLSQIACVGDSISFVVAATGTGLTYQWRIGAVDIIGATSDTLTLNPVSLLDAALNYNVVVFGACLPNDTSINASLILNPTTNITSQPLNQVACLGDSVGFTVSAIGANLSYQWYLGIVPIIGATNDTLTINPVTLANAALNYNVIVTGSCSSDTSVNAFLNIDSIVNIITQPVSQTVCAGDSASFVVAATGANLSYQWYLGIVPIIGATNDTLTINPVTLANAALNYNVIVTGSCSSDTSVNAFLNIDSIVNIITQPVSQTVCAGDSVSFVVVATGTNLTYQWYLGIVPIIGATNDTLTINPVTLADAALNYNVIVTGSCSNDTSTYVFLNIDSVINIIMQPVSQTVCAGDSVSFIVIASGTNLTYQWNIGTTPIIGATNDTLTFNPANVTDTALNYNVIIAGSCAIDTSNYVALVVNPLPVAIASSNSPVCSGDSIFLNAQIVLGASYNWTGPDAFAAITQNAVIINATETNEGIYSLTVVSNGCTSVPFPMLVVVNECSIDLSIVKTVNNATPFFYQNIIFTIVATNNGSEDATAVTVSDLLQSGYQYISSTATMGAYNPTTGIWNIGNLNVGVSAVLTVTVSVNASGIYVNTASISGIEQDINSINDVSVIETYPTDFFIPDGFSPNSDGVNDLFIIRGIFNYPDNSIVIFNRWGAKVFEASPYQNTWDGNASNGLIIGGGDVPVGTYFYLLNLGNNTDVIKGTIYLNR